MLLLCVVIVVVVVVCDVFVCVCWIRIIMKDISFDDDTLETWKESLGGSF